MEENEAHIQMAKNKTHTKGVKLDRYINGGK